LFFCRQTRREREWEKGFASGIPNKTKITEREREREREREGGGVVFVCVGFGFVGFFAAM
jgi:hypothetical protein